MEKKRHGSTKTLHHRQAPEFQQISRNLAARIRGQRRARHWTIEKAAEKFQIEASHLKRLEDASANPTLALLVSIAKALGVSVSRLLQDADE